MNDLAEDIEVDPSVIDALRDDVISIMKLMRQMAAPIPFDKQLWGKERLAEFFNCSVDSVDRVICSQRSFPKGRRRNVDSDRGALLWKAKAVTDWADENIFEEVL